MDENIIKFPYIKVKQRIINEKGQGCVPCEVSDRWIQFDKKSHLCEGGEFISISIMTQVSDNKEHKICDMIVTREDLERALRYVKPIQMELGRNNSIHKIIVNY